MTHEGSLPSKRSVVLKVPLVFLMLFVLDFSPWDELSFCGLDVNMESKPAQDPASASSEVLNQSMLDPPLNIFVFVSAGRFYNNETIINNQCSMQWQHVIWPTVIFLDDQNATPVSNLAMPTFKQKDHTTIFFCDRKFQFFFLHCNVRCHQPAHWHRHRWWRGEMNLWACDWYIALQGWTALLQPISDLSLSSLCFHIMLFVFWFVPTMSRGMQGSQICYLEHEDAPVSRPIDVEKNRLCDQTCKSLESIVGWRFCMFLLQQNSMRQQR